MKIRNSLSVIIAVLLYTTIILEKPVQAQGVVPHIIESISPASADAGTPNLTVTITLLNLGTPPVPPSEVTPSGLRIGTLEARSISRSNLLITAIIDIPETESGGTKDVVLTFPGPNNQEIVFTLSGGFTVTGNDTSDNPVIVTADTGDYVIVDTGQETCYNATQAISTPRVGEDFYGQDAQFEGNQPSYTVSEDGLTVYDNVTGLTWTRGADWNGDETVDVNDKFTYTEALNYVSVINAQNYGDYNDWRLPSIKELYSLIDYRGTDPSPTGTSASGLVPFINDEVFEFAYGDISGGERIIDSQWATTTLYVSTVMNGQQAMFGVNFADGRIKGYPADTNPGGFEKTFYVRFCRGNTEYGKNSFTDNGDGTVTDSATGLMWSQSDNGAGVNWEDALSWVQQMNDVNYLGYNDWRLPNAKELQSLVDYTRSPDTHGTAAIDPLFNATQITNEAGQPDYPFYWSSTTFLRFDGSADRAVYVAFGRGLGSMDGTTVIDVHGAGCQRSDSKDGNPDDYPNWGFGPQGDVQRVYNYVRLVRTVEISETSEDDSTDDGNVTLFAPMGNTNTYLIDADDDIVHSWESDYTPALSAYLLDDRSLLRTASPGRNANSVFGSEGGAGGIVEQYDWEGNKTWEFEYNSSDYLLHHDIEALPSGNILMIAWEYKSETEAIEAGRNPSLLSDGELWPDKIIEVEPDGSSGGTIVWEWHVWDHLIQDYDASKANYGTVSDHPEKIDINFVLHQPNADWTHINGVDYNADLDQILLTAHNFSEIWIIDHNTTTTEAAGAAGDLLYRWGNPQTYGRGNSNDQQLFVPHDGQWIDAGCPGEDDILIFNNGQNRQDGNYSTVDEITPPWNGSRYTINNGSAYEPFAPDWTYKGDPASSFYADHISGAQRLPDGSTLICDGPAGKFFEVTSSGETVWEYTNPFSFTTPQGESNEVFRATCYNLNDLNTGVEDDMYHESGSTGLPEAFTLNQNYPNPFNPTTSITYSLTKSANIELAVFNLQGQRIKTLMSGMQAAGDYEVTWDGTNENGMKVASGIYIYQLITGNQRTVKKMTLMK